MRGRYDSQGTSGALEQNCPHQEANCHSPRMVEEDRETSRSAKSIAEES